MAGKRKDMQGRLAAANERVRNRASPDCIVKLCEHLNADQKRVIEHMSLGSMLNIKCLTLHNPVINWLAPKYDRFSRAFIIPGRGRIPLTVASVYRSMGLPCGEVPVTYGMDASIEKRLAPILFPDHPNTPRTTQVFAILKEMTTADKNFKQIWIMYLVSTVLAPTSLNKVSSRCYPIMDKVEEVKNMNISQFVCDKLHDELSVGKLSGACLLHMMLLYVDSLDISALNIVLPEAPFLVNVWSKANIDIVLDADMKIDFSGFGNLELKPHLAIDHMFFGGIDGFQGFIDTNTAHNCPKPRKEKVAKLVGEFAAGITGLLGTLVQGWTEVDEDDAVVVEQSIQKFSRQLGVDGTNFTSSLVFSKSSDRAIPVDSSPPSERTPKNGDIPKSSGNQAASVVSKGIVVQTSPATHFDSSDCGGAPLLTPVASQPGLEPIGARNNGENNVHLMGSETRHVNSQRDYSAYNVDIAAGDNVCDDGEHVSSAGFSVPSHDFSMPTQDYGAGGHFCSVEGIHDELRPSYPATAQDFCTDHGKFVGMTVTQEGIFFCNEQPAVSRNATFQGKYKSSRAITEHNAELMKVSDVGSHGASTPILDGIWQYNSHNLKRRMKDDAITISDGILCPSQEKAASHVLKKSKKPSPTRKKPKVNAVGTRSSPRFQVKHHGKTDANQDSQAASSNGVEVQKISVNHGTDATSNKVPSEAIQKTVSVVGRSSPPPPKRHFSARLCISTPISDANTIDGKQKVSKEVPKAEVDTSQGENADKILQVKQSIHDRPWSDPDDDDVQIIYVTPAVPRDPPFSPPSITPRTRLRVGRVIQPSKFLLPPYVHISSTPEQDELYQQVIKHKSDSKDSKIKGSMFLQIKPMWVTTGDLADSITGELSNTVAEIGISVLQDYCDQKKIIFPWILTVYLLDHKFSSRIVEHHFRRDDKYILSHKNVLMFPVLQDIGTVQKPRGHWYAVSLNFNAKRFEVLDSARGRGDVSLIEHASSLVEAIKCAYRVNYAKSSKQINDYQLEYIDVPKQNNSIDCGFFMLKFLELWDGRVVPAITYDQIPEYKVLTWTWLYHPRNKFINWKYYLESNKI